MTIPPPTPTSLIQLGLPAGRSRGASRRSPSRSANAVTLCSATLSEDGKTEPPIGPLYIAAALERMDVEVDFRDLQLDPNASCFSGDELARALDDHHDIVAISCFVDMLPAVIAATRRLHKNRPDTIFLLGGPGPTAAAQRILERYHWITAIVRGEGEETVSDWIDLVRGKRMGPIAGMIYRDGPELVVGGDRARNHELDQLPLPAYHLLDWSRYSSARVITTRGCSYRCSFCDVTALWGNRSVYRSLEATIAEIELLRDRYGMSSIGIVDDTFVLNRERVRAFCHLLIDRRANIQWGCFGRINLMTPDLVDLMAEAGCRAIFYGIDSGSQAVLDRTVKKVKAKDILPVLKQSAQSFDFIEASFIWGYPFETLADFRATLEIASEAALLAPLVNVQFHLLSPLPLSPIYREFPDGLHEPEEEDRPWLLLPPLFFEDKAGELRRLVRSAPDIHSSFYSYETPARRTKRKLLGRSMTILNRIVGRTFFDSRHAQLLLGPNPEVEREILTAYQHPAEKIGAGLAVSFFRRSRLRAAFERGENPFSGKRGPHMTRERTIASGGQQ
jgi:radical SAM superfamily enzyme YgiQ (UPF0313 family)